MKRIHRTIAALAVCLIPLTAGCGAGEDAPVLEVMPDHPSGDVGPVGVRSLMLLSPPSGGEGAAVVTLVNRSAEPQRLESLQIGPAQGDSSSSPVEVTAGVAVPPNGAVHVGAEGQPTIPVPRLDLLAEAGMLVPVTLIFDKAGRLTLDVIVQEATGPYASFLPTSG